MDRHDAVPAPPRARFAILIDIINGFTNRPIFYLAVSLTWFICLLLTAVLVYLSTFNSLKKNLFYMRVMHTLAYAFTVSRQSPYIRKVTSRIFDHPATTVTGSIATIAVSSSSIFRATIDIYPTSWDTITWKYGANREQLVQLMSSVIRTALCVISIIMIHIFSSLRERRTQITITYRMILMSIGVILYHLWMIECVFLKRATAQPDSVQFLLLWNIGTYIIHAAYQMEYIFTYFKNGQMQVNTTRSSILSILFNCSMLVHFLFVVKTCDSASCNYYLLAIVFLVEIFHRLLALCVFGHLLLNRFRVVNINAHEEVTVRRAADKVTKEIQVFCQRNKSFMVSGLPPTTDHTGAMITGQLVSLLPHHIPSRQDCDQPSEEMCYTSTALQDTQPLPRTQPLPLVDGYCSSDIQAVCMPQPTIADQLQGIC